MERASLRPVPQRPSGPVDPAEALAHVETKLPGLDDAARQALALVDLVGRKRAEASTETGVGDADLAEALARARKALRRAAFPLPGSGWCERAERLLSDELDGALANPGPRRLAAHLANCDRCVEHERRLWQARDGLVASFEESRAPRAEAQPEPQIADEPDHEPVELPDREPAEALPAAAPTPELRLVEPPPQLPAAEAAEPVAEVPAPPAPAEPAPAEPEPAEPEPALPEPAEPEPAEPEPVAEDAATTATAEARLSLRTVAWAASTAFAVLLAIVSLALTIYAIAGGGF